MMLIICVKIGKRPTFRLNMMKKISLFQIPY